MLSFHVYGGVEYGGMHGRSIGQQMVSSGARMVDRLSEDPIKVIKTGDMVEVNGTTGEVTIF